MSVLVTGGGGFLGRAIVDRLLAEGHSVRVLNRSAYSDLQKRGVEVLCGNLADRECVVKAGRGCEAVFHVAAKAGVWGNEKEYWQVNVEGTRNVLECCRSNDIANLIYTSTPSVVFNGESIRRGDESLPYASNVLCHYPKTKSVAEGEVLQASLRGEVQALALRPHLLWGPGDPHLIPRILDRVRAGRLRQVGSGHNLVDITYIDNAADAHILAWKALQTRPREAAGRAYFIAQDEPVNLWDWIRTLLKGFDLTLPTRAISFRAAYTAGAVLETLHRCFAPSKEPMMTRFVAQQLALDHYYSHKAARDILGFVPQVSIEEGLRRVWQYSWE